MNVRSTFLDFSCGVTVASETMISGTFLDIKGETAFLCCWKIDLIGEYEITDESKALISSLMATSFLSQSSGSFLGLL